MDGSWFESNQRYVPKITYMKWHYVEKYDFYDVMYELDEYAFHRAYVHSHRLKGIDKSLPDAIAYLLRAELACVPERGPERPPDEWN